jgi:methionyl-tRNA synthetase
LGEPDEEGLGILTAIQKTQQEISIHYESMNYSKVIREITSLGDILNQYINNRQPWALVKTDIEATRKVVTTAIQGAYYLFTYLEPILPNMSKLVFDMMGNSDSKGFARLKDQLYNKTIQPYKNLSQRVDEAKVKIIMSQFQSQEDSKKVPSKEEPKQNPAQDQKKENYITIDDLAKIEIRVGEILEAQPVEGADKLLQLTVSLGPLGNRNVFAGIKSSYKPEELKGLRVAVVANLKPRTMKFGVSEAMILAAGKEGNLSVFTPNRDAQPGDLLK